MLELVIDKLLRRREEILRRIEELALEGGLGESIEWLPLPPPRRGLLVGVDGGMNLKEYRDFAVYAVDAEAVAAGEEGLVPIVRAADVDVIFPYWLPRERVRLYMATLEAKCAIRALAEVDDSVVVLDGSLISVFVRPVPYTELMARSRSLSRIMSDYLPLFEESAERGETELRAKEAVAEILESTGDVKDAQTTALFLEYLEYLAAFRELVRGFKARVVAVAKRSYSREIFRRSVPDMTIVERLTRSTGYFRKVEPRALADAKWRLPAYGNELSSLSFTVIYARLENESPVLKIELVGDAGESTIKSVLGLLRKHSVNGYPYPLTRAHRDVEITSADIETLARALRLHWAKTGREHLSRRKRAAFY